MSDTIIRALEKAAQLEAELEAEFEAWLDWQEALRHRDDEDDPVDFPDELRRP